jgi:hypothetical protein
MIVMMMDCGNCLPLVINSKYVIVIVVIVVIVDDNFDDDNNDDDLCYMLYLLSL